MKYNQPYGISDPNAAYINGDPSIGRAGSIPPAEAIEIPQREIVNMITKGGLSPDNADLFQLTKAIQGGKIIASGDTGSATAYVCTLDPPIASYADGLVFWMVPANANTGPATVNVNGRGVRNIVRRGGNPLQAGDMPQGYKSLLCYNAPHNNFELYGTGFSQGAFLPILTANTNLYVNIATGDDTLYDGSAPTISGAHGPFKTIAKAMAETFKYGPSVYTMTINIAAGTYPEPCKTPAVRGPSLIIQGAGKTTTTVQGETDGHTFFCGNGNSMWCKNIGGTANLGTFGPPSIFVAYAGGVLLTDDVQCGSSFGFSYWAEANGMIAAGNTQWAAGANCQAAFNASNASSIALYPGVSKTQATYTFAGALNVSQAFVRCSQSSSVFAVQSPYTNAYVGFGNVVGPKFSAIFNGVIYAQGNGVNFFPGTVAGGTATGGQYG